jgi:hypothetical protein
MKTLIVAAAAMGVGMSTSLAQPNSANGNGPAAPITPFTVWSMESQTGKRMIPMPELIKMAHDGRGLDAAPAPRGRAEGPPAQTTVAPN